MGFESIDDRIITIDLLIEVYSIINIISSKSNLWNGRN